MSIEVKYKIKEVADDFAMPAKDVIEVVGKFFPKPKSSSQNLSEEQLNVVFDYLTQTHQIASLEEVFAAAPAPKAPEKAAEAPKTAPAAAPAQASAPKASDAAKPAPAQQKPAAQQPSAKPAAPAQPERKRERRVIDTSAVTVNADRYDDRVDSLVSERVRVCRCKPPSGQSRPPLQVRTFANPPIRPRKRSAGKPADLGFFPYAVCATG